MKIKPRTNRPVNLTALLEKFKEKYRNLYIFQFEDQVFIYRAIGRKEYKDLVLNKNLSDQEKEEVECSLCVLYPENYDFANCEEAGLPTLLSQEIEKHSYVSEEDRQKVLQYHKSEMFDLDNQINCIILAAFNNLSLDEVENWDVVTACKYFSRAEWILHNINGVPFKQKDPGSTFVSKKQGPPVTPSEEVVTKPKQKKEEQPKQEEKPQKESRLADKPSWIPDHPSVQKQGEVIKPEVKENPVTKNVVSGGMGSSPMTVKSGEEHGFALGALPIKSIEKVGEHKHQASAQELAALKARYPEIDWDNDLGKAGFSGFKQPDILDTAPALRSKGSGGKYLKEPPKYKTLAEIKAEKAAEKEAKKQEEEKNNNKK